MTRLTNTFDAIAIADGVERLDLIDWDRMHEAVQAVLRDLDNVVVDGAPGARARAGRNSAKTWSLYSYRTYDADPSLDIDPVTVGVTFSVSGESIEVHGEISGESRGDVIHDEPIGLMMGTLAVTESARDVAERLVRRSAAIIRALNDPSRKS